MKARRVINKLTSWREISCLSAPSWLIGFRHDLYASLGQPTLLVYTMGKVGSTTAYHSLRHSSVSPLIYHVHFLTEANIQRTSVKYEKSRGYASSGVTIGQLIRGDFDHLAASRMLLSRSFRKKWYLISIIRDPVATFLSHVFQNPKVHRPQLLRENGTIDQKKVEDYINDHFCNFIPENDYISNWFDNEFREFTGIDVYRHDFDSRAGYCLIRDDLFDVAIASLECLDRIFSQVVSELIGNNQEIEIIRKNVRSSGSDAALYGDIKRLVKIPKDSLYKVYSTNYAKHFFSAEYISEMIDKWAKPSNSKG